MFKYLGAVLDHKLTFNDKTDAIFRCQQRLFLLSKLRNMDMNNDLLPSFYGGYIESAWTFFSFDGFVH